MVQTFNEFRVTLDLKGEILTKKKTDRGTVRISQQTANTNNLYVKSKKLFYELAKEQPKKVEAKKKEVPAKEEASAEEITRDDIKATAKELGIEFPKNIKTKKLIELINEKRK